MHGSVYVWVYHIPIIIVFAYYFNYMHQDISPTSPQCLHNYTASI